MHAPPSKFCSWEAGNRSPTPQFLSPAIAGPCQVPARPYPARHLPCFILSHPDSPQGGFNLRLWTCMWPENVVNIVWCVHNCVNSTVLQISFSSYLFTVFSGLFCVALYTSCSLTLTAAKQPLFAAPPTGPPGLSTSVTSSSQCSSATGSSVPSPHWPLGYRCFVTAGSPHMQSQLRVPPCCLAEWPSQLLPSPVASPH